MTDNTVERARGRWLEILPLMGVSLSFLRNKHGPCPMCGGKDRFRFDDKAGDGTYYCNQCGPGNGLSFVKKFKGWDHRAACDEIDRIVGVARAKQYVQQPQSDDSRRLDALQKLLGEAGDASVVEAYLWRRGLNCTPTPLLGHPACPYWDEDTGKMVGRFPAVLAPILGPDGNLVSVQRIYDAELRPRKKTMPPVGTINKAAVRLFPVDDEMGIAEGVETAIAASLKFGVPTWAALSAHGMEVFDPPAGVTRLHIFGDNDENFEGQAAAHLLARRLCREAAVKELPPPELYLNIPSDPGVDWLDIYAARQKPLRIA